MSNNECISNEIILYGTVHKLLSKSGGCGTCRPCLRFIEENSDEAEDVSLLKMMQRHIVREPGDTLPQSVSSKPRRHGREELVDRLLSHLA